MGMFIAAIESNDSTKTIVRSIFKGVFVVFFKKVSGDTPINQKKHLLHFLKNNHMLKLPQREVTRWI
jgi:hypothetical protein